MSADVPFRLRDQLRSRDELEGRMLNAWRACGLPLPVLLARAAERYEILGAHSLTEMSDAAAIEMVERYIREYGS